MIKTLDLGVNIDHVATLRQARGGNYPNPVQAALVAEESGADGITLHLREDRRHIQPNDVRAIKDVINTKMNFEMAATSQMLDFAEEIMPDNCCIVPEKREELTTEGGLDLLINNANIEKAIKRLHSIGIRVSLFIDPEHSQIEAAAKLQADAIELHTGAYANSFNNFGEQQRHIYKLKTGAKFASELGLVVNAGHGLNYHNVKPVASILEIMELNIGHAIIGRALFVGLNKAISYMRQLMIEARSEIIKSL